MTISTNNFHPDTDRKLLCTCGNPGCDGVDVAVSSRQEYDKLAILGRPMLDCLDFRATSYSNIR